MTANNGDDRQVKRVNHIRISFDLSWAGSLVAFKAQCTDNDADVVHVAAERALRMTSIKEHADCQRAWDYVTAAVRAHVAELLVDQPLMRFLPAELNGGPVVVDGAARVEPELEAVGANGHE